MNPFDPETLKTIEFAYATALNLFDVPTTAVAVITSFSAEDSHEAYEAFEDEIAPGVDTQLKGVRVGENDKDYEIVVMYPHDVKRNIYVQVGIRVRS